MRRISIILFFISKVYLNPISRCGSDSIQIHYVNKVPKIFIPYLPNVNFFKPVIDTSFFPTIINTNQYSTNHPLIQPNVEKWKEVEENYIKSGSFTWKIVKPSRKLGNLIVKLAASEAFNIWSKVSNITFIYDEKVSSSSDINISFTDLNHKTSTNKNCIIFKASELGHAYFPDSIFAGELHINDNQWFNGYYNTNTYSLLHLFTHEIGHLLGLKHTSRKTSIMFPFEPVNRHFTISSILDSNDSTILRKNK